MNDVELRVCEKLNSATKIEDILEAIEMLDSEPRTASSEALVAAAGSMLATRLD